MAFKIPEDIANRALQHCGATRIVTLQDDSKNAAEIAQCYDGLRRAELRRNLWTFSCRRAVLYPVNTALAKLPFGSATTGTYNTWSATQTYAVGTIVLASDGLLYQALQTNTNINPAFGGSAGTIWASLGNPSQGNRGPMLPTMLLQPVLWSAVASYAYGAIVQDVNGAIWVNLTQNNVGNQPGTDAGANWDTYFGSMCVNPWLPPPLQTPQGRGYYIGDLVYEEVAPGQINVYVSLENGNTNDPSAPSPWNSTQTFGEGEVVVDSAGFFWQSTMPMNTANQPGVYGFWSTVPTYTIGALVIGSDNVLYQALISTTNVNPANAAHPTDWLALGYPGSWPMWNSTTTYAKNAIVAGVDGKLYQAVQSNTGNQPVGSTYNPNTPATNFWSGLRLPNPWIANFKTSTAGGSWLALDAAVIPLNINYPVGTGPSRDSLTRNVYLLPNGYLRTAPQEPKSGNISFLGSPGGLMNLDWEYNGKFIVSSNPYPILLRFGADVTQVSTMDDMFCEGLAARIAAEVVETLTQSGSKLGNIVSDYKKFMDEARTVNGIEQGSTEPAMDDYIACRV